MKWFTIGVAFSMLLTAAVQSYAAEAQINFVLQSGGGYLDDDMYTIASGIDGSIHWMCDRPAYKSGVSSLYYHMSYLLDGIHDNTMDHVWMPQTSLNSGSPCEYLRIDFPEAVYLTKIRTYNVAYVGTGNGAYRWMESLLMVSADGIDYTQVGDVTVNLTPSYDDYVDIEINAWVQAIEYLPYEDGENTPNYYGMSDVIMFMDDNPMPNQPAIPEPASVMLMCCSLLGFFLRKTKR